MKKIILILSLLLGSISLMAQNYIYGDARDEIVTSDDGRTTVGVRAISRYNLSTQKLEIYIGGVARNGNNQVTMQGSVSNLLPMYIHETVTHDGQTFIFDVNHNKDGYYTRLRGEVDFKFGNLGIYITLPINIDVPKP